MMKDHAPLRQFAPFLVATVSVVLATATAETLEDDFSGGLGNWMPSTRGLENNAEAGYDDPGISGGVLMLGGFTESQYWFGSSLMSVADFSTRQRTEITVNRVSLTGAGTAWRSSLWIYGDEGHYMHFSQNVGENGWSWNARDDGGAGTSAPTGGGNNIADLDGFDADDGSFQMGIRIEPVDSGTIDVTLVHDGVDVAVHQFTSFPATFKVMLTGQARAAGDEVRAGFDDFSLVQEEVENLAPAFRSGNLGLPQAIVGEAYAGSVADEASDADGDPLSFSKASGPDWVSVSAEGVLSGTPAAADAGLNVVVVEVSDGAATARANARITVSDPNAPREGVVFEDDFSGGLDKWAWSTVGLENDAPAGYNDPVATGGQLKLGGVTDSQYWFGNSLVSAAAFDSRAATQVSVTRVSLTGNGTAWRSSLWIYGDAGHYLHYSQNAGETGWSWNARDDGGDGTLAPTGSGNNIADLDSLDVDEGSFQMAILTEPVAEGVIDVTLLHDGDEVAQHRFTNFPNLFKVVLTGQARAAGDEVTALFDDLVVRREQVDNLPPTFTSDPLQLESATVGQAYAQNLAAHAGDADGDALAFAKSGGPAWISVSPEGILSGTPSAGDAGANAVTVEVTDGKATGQTTARIRVMDPKVPLRAWWPLNEGSGAVAGDATGNGFDGEIFNAEDGGLGNDGAVWLDDDERGTVASFNGEDGSGAHVFLGRETLPLMTQDNAFTWMFWANSQQAPNNDIIFGNRYNTNNADFIPRQFIKFTTSNFEWDTNNVQGFNYDDIPEGEWMHHAVVKTGLEFVYYRNGEENGAGFADAAPAQRMPLYLAGQGVENWAGYLSDVRIYQSALSADEVAEAMVSEPGPATRFEITMVERREASVLITWNSSDGGTYAIDTSADLGNWQEVTDSFPGEGEQTTYEALGVGADVDVLYIRVREQ